MFRCVSMCAYTVNVWVPNSDLMYGPLCTIATEVKGTWGGQLLLNKGHTN